jgi:signal peptidase II
MPDLPPSGEDSHEPRIASVAGASANSETVNPKSHLTRFFAYRRFWALAFALFILDQWTKYSINAQLPLGSYGATGHTVIPGFFNLVHVGNTGAAWSMFSGKSTGLALLAAATLAAIFLWRRALGLRHSTVQAAFGLLCGGIVGNLVDRIVHGHVIDFIDLHFGTYTYPTFNVADSGICVGVFWYILWSLRQPPDQQNSKSQVPNAK